MTQICKYLGDGKFRIAEDGYEVIVSLRCEVEEVNRGNIRVYPREDGEISFDEVNHEAMKAINQYIAAASRRT